MTQSPSVRLLTEANAATDAADPATPLGAALSATTATQVASEISTPGKAARVAIDALIPSRGGYELWQPSTAYTIGQRVVHPSGDVKVSLTNHTSGTSSPGTVNWGNIPAVATEIADRKRDQGRQFRNRVITRPRAVKAVALPATLGWTAPAGFALFFDGVKYFTKYDAAVRKNTGGTTRYIHTVTGNDTTGTGADTAPYQTLAKAHTVAADGDTIIIQDQGVAYRNQLNANAVMYKSLNIIAQYPDKLTLVAGDNLTYTLSAGTTNVYESARSSVQRVVDLLVDPDGFRYTNVASIAACDALPGSWYSDGTKVYVHTIDNSVPTSTRIIALLGVNLFEFASTARSSNGNVYFEGLRILSGTNGVKITGTATWDMAFTAKNCRFLHGHLSTADGVQLVDVGSSVIQDSTVAHTGKDGFNYHQSVRVTNFLEINCEAHSIGLDRGTDYTMNGSTCHDGIKGVRIGGKYHYANGTPVADVHVGTKTANYSCDSWDSLGGTGTGYNAGFSTQQSGAEMWLYRCRAWGTESDLYYVTGTNMHVDDLTEYDTKTGGGTLDVISAG